MGKKKNKNKVSGAVKTAAKTEKKLANKLKKELANLGEVSSYMFFVILCFRNQYAPFYMAQVSRDLKKWKEPNKLSPFFI